MQPKCSRNNKLPKLTPQFTLELSYIGCALKCNKGLERQSSNLPNSRF